MPVVLDRRTEVSVPQDDNEIDEAQVLSVVINAFSPLSLDAKKRLLQTVATFFDLGLPAQANRVHSSEPPTLQPGSFSQDRSASAKDFLHEKDPDSETERFVCLAYYLTHYRGIQHFKTLDISELNTEAAQIKFSNSTAVASAAANQGLIGPAPGGLKQLTARGERLVSLLPDREAARSAIGNNRPTRRSKKRRAGKAD